MVRDGEMRSVSCPYCGKRMRKHPKKAEYVCENPRCPVILVRIRQGTRHVAREPRFGRSVKGKAKRDEERTQNMPQMWIGS